MNQLRVIRKYVFGVSRNVSWINGHQYFMDAAVAQLAEKEVKTEQSPNQTVNAVQSTGDFCKSRTTVISNIEIRGKQN